MNDPAEELRNAIGNAWSIRPGEPPPGDMIGIVERCGIRFQYFRDHTGAYWYRTVPEYDPRKK